MADPVAQTGDGGRRKWFSRKPAMGFLLPLLVVVLAGAGGIGLKWWQNKHKVAPPAVVAVNSQDKAFQGDLNAAQKEIDDALQRDNLSNQDKYLLYYQKGTNLQNDGKNKEALDLFKKAATYKQTYSLYHSMAMVAEATGDIQGAITYLKQAIPLVGAPPENPVAEDDKKALEEKIKSLEAQL